MGFFGKSTRVRDAEAASSNLVASMMRGSPETLRNQGFRGFFYAKRAAQKSILMQYGYNVNQADGTTVAETELQIADVLRRIIREGLSGWEFDAEMCSYVEDCLQRYADIGVWQNGTDLDWFAPVGQGPQQPWIIEHNGELPDFWQETDTWQWMGYVGNFSDSFLTWYTGECGCNVPDIEKIVDMWQGN